MILAFFVHWLSFVYSVADFGTITVSERAKLSIIHALVAPPMPFFTVAGQERCSDNVRMYLVWRLQEIETATMTFEDLCSSSGKPSIAAIIEALEIDGGFIIRRNNIDCYDEYMQSFADQIIAHNIEICAIFKTTSSSASANALFSLFAVVIAWLV